MFSDATGPEAPSNAASQIYMQKNLCQDGTYYVQCNPTQPISLDLRPAALLPLSPFVVLESNPSVEALQCTAVMTDSYPVYWEVTCASDTFAVKRFVSRQGVVGCS